MAGTERILVLAMIFGVGFCDIDWSDCGKTKYCEATEGDAFKVSYFETDDKVRMELYTKREDKDGEKYLAVGFSDDPKMGNEPVVACLPAPDGKALIRHSSNSAGKDNKEAPADFKPTAQLIKFEATEDYSYCQFDLPVNKDKATGLEPDLTKPVFLLLAKGGVQDDNQGLNYHSNRVTMPSQHYLVKRTPAQINETIAEQDQKDPNAKPPTKYDSPPPLKEANRSGSGPFDLSTWAKVMLLRYHGVAMLFGWFGFLFSGVFAARYLRNMWPNTTVGGLRIWFHVHRILNSFGVMLVVMGSVLVFVAKDLEWTGPSAEQNSAYNTTPAAIHSLVGAISVLLALAQPFGALARCGVDSPKRPIFNFLHRGAGLLALLLALTAAIIAIFYFYTLFYSRVIAIAVLMAFLVVGVIISVVQEVVKFKDENEQQRIVAIEMRNRSKQSAPSDSYYFRERQAHSDRHKKATVFLFLIFVVIGFIAAAILTYLILDA